MTVECARHFSSVSSNLKGHELDQVEKFCEVSCFYLRHTAEEFVRERLEVPLLFQYGNDSTPSQTLGTYRCDSVAFTKPFYRRGRGGKDFLAEKLFITDGDKVVVVFTDPHELDDKTAWTAFEASRRLFPLPRQLGHRSITVLAHIYDGALFLTVVRHQRQRVEAVQLQEASRQQWSAGHASLMDLFTWLVAACCINHVVHNGLKWSVSGFINDPSCMRSAYIAVASLRTSFTTLAEHAASWVQVRIEFEDWESLARPTLWELLVSDPELRAVLTHMQLRFSAGRLRVARSYLGSTTVVNEVVTVLLRLWQFHNFCDSRWCTLGPVARTMVASLLLGLPDLVAYILADAQAKKHYIACFSSHCTTQVKHLFSIV